MAAHEKKIFWLPRDKRPVRHNLSTRSTVANHPTAAVARPAPATQ